MRSGGRAGLLAGVVVALLALTGCSGDGAEPSSDAAPSDTQRAEVDDAAVTRDLARFYAGDHSTPDGREEGRCFAEALMREVDADDLAAAGVIDSAGGPIEGLPTLDQATAEAWVSAQESCTSFLDASTEALRAQSKGAVDADRYRDCLDERLTEQQAHDAQVAALTGDLAGDAVAALSDAQRTCATQALPQD